MAKPYAKRFYSSDTWQCVREEILRRDNYMCTWCGSPNNLEIDHIIELKPWNINDPNITINPRNLRTLCRDCHCKRHKEDRLKGYKHKPALREGLKFDKDGYVIEDKTM